MKLDSDSIREIVSSVVNSNVFDKIINAVKKVEDLVDSVRKSVNEGLQTLKEMKSTLSQVNKCMAKGSITYKLITLHDEERLFPAHCYDTDYAEHLLTHTFQSNANIMPGDYINVNGDWYGIGRAKVINRVYNFNEQVVYLICERANEEDDYIFIKHFKDKVEDLCDKLMSLATTKHNLETENVTEPYDIKKDRDAMWDIIGKCAELADGHTTTCFAVVLDQVEKIVYNHIGEEIPKKERMDF